MENPSKLISFKILLCLFGLLTAHPAQLQAQTISVYPVQDMGFGAFIQGSSGGSVTVSHNGIRSSSGDLILANLGVPYFPAIFEIEAPKGTILSILNGPDTQLTGSNGGSITLSLGASDKGQSFTTTVEPPQRTSLQIGGTLTVSNPQNNPAGNYTGTFSVTFIQE